MKPPAPIGDPPPDSKAPDPREVARFLRAQPPRPVPARTRPPAPVGLLARTLLGARVHPRG